MTSDRTPQRRPQPPTPPADADCCGEGCPRCVFDVYDEAVAAFEARLAKWQVIESLRTARTKSITQTSDSSARGPDRGADSKPDRGDN